MSKPLMIAVPASREVLRLLGTRIRVRLPEFDGYGRVVNMEGSTGPDHDEHCAILELENE